MKSRRLFLPILTISCFAISGCDGPTIGPRVETKTVIVYPGQPLQILSNVKVTGRRLADDDQVVQDIGGWVAMPREHFEALARKAGLVVAAPVPSP